MESLETPIGLVPLNHAEYVRNKSSRWWHFFRSEFIIYENVWEHQIQIQIRSTIVHQDKISYYIGPLNIVWIGIESREKPRKFLFYESFELIK